MLPPGKAGRWPDPRDPAGAARARPRPARGGHRPPVPQVCAGSLPHTAPPPSAGGGARAPEPPDPSENSSGRRRGAGEVRSPSDLPVRAKPKQADSVPNHQRKRKPISDSKDSGRLAEEGVQAQRPLSVPVGAAARGVGLPVLSRKLSSLLSTAPDEFPPPTPWAPCAQSPSEVRQPITRQGQESGSQSRHEVRGTSTPAPNGSLGSIRRTEGTWRHRKVISSFQRFV